MSFLADIFSAIGQFIIHLISLFGYAGIIIAMAFESMITPLPSELIMPFAGFLVAQGEMNFWIVVAAGTLGSWIGSTISYWIGQKGGLFLVKKIGKYVLMDESDLTWTTEFFKKNGPITIFIGRLIPVVRHLISIPAGIAQMNFFKFSFYTILGAALWSFILTAAGFVLGTQWHRIRDFTEPISIVVVCILLIGITIMIWRHFSRHKL